LWLQINDRNRYVHLSGIPLGTPCLPGPFFFFRTRPPWGSPAELRNFSSSFVASFFGMCCVFVSDESRFSLFCQTFFPSLEVLSFPCFGSLFPFWWLKDETSTALDCLSFPLFPPAASSLPPPCYVFFLYDSKQKNLVGGWGLCFFDSFKEVPPLQLWRHPFSRLSDKVFAPLAVIPFGSQLTSCGRELFF